MVELDGRAFHDTAAARDDDASRDLETVATSGSLTVRLTWALVVRDGCRTAAHLATLMGRRGWTGTLTRCGSCQDPAQG